MAERRRARQLSSHTTVSHTRLTPRHIQASIIL